MKKLLIAAAIVCAAAMSQAAAIAWSSPIIYAGDATGAFTSTTLKSSTGITGFSIALTFFDASGNELTTVSGTSTSAFQKNGSTKGTTSGYDFLVDTDYKYSAHYEYTAANGDLYTMDVGPTAFTQTKGTGDYSLAVADAGKWTVQGVPEPTSGLLLLLGVAGLALRRRRA